MRSSRRQLLTLALTLPTIAGGLASGCTRGGGKKIVVRFWNGFTGPDGRTMLRMVQHFNANNPDVEVLMQRMDWATYYNKLFVSGLGGRAPEVFVLQTHSVPRFARANFVRGVDDLSGRPGDLAVKISTPMSRKPFISGRSIMGFRSISGRSACTTIAKSCATMVLWILRETPSRRRTAIVSWMRQQESPRLVFGINRSVGVCLHEF